MLTSLKTLINKDNYTPGLWDLKTNQRAIEHWTEVFSENTKFIYSLIKNDLNKLSEAELYEKKMNKIIPFIKNKEFKTVHDITIIREGILHELNIDDPFIRLKTIQNNEAFIILPVFIKHLDNRNFNESLAISISAILEGNLFDLGSSITTHMWIKGNLKFNIPDLNGNIYSYCKKIIEKEEKTVTILVDNAGFDYIVGCVSFIYQLLKLDWKVIVAANESPALNDVTFTEVLEMNNKIDKTIQNWNKFINDGKLVFISSGVKTPGMDLRKISEKLNSAVNSSSLLIIIGQGRAIETTLTAVIDRDVLRIAKVKDSMVSEHLNVEELSDFIQWSKRGENIFVK